MDSHCLVSCCCTCHQVKEVSLTYHVLYNVLTYNEYLSTVKQTD